ncbi:MAG: hypothetical protein ACTHW2_09175 [Tissierella sp.]|uniref:hypothetical protein n=1 Tax=Tissierella sp. TaxID=41274 RepID=UPI003F9D556F
MKENSLGFKILYILVGIFFFFAYYYLMNSYIKVDPTSIPWIIVTIYMLIAIVLFPYSGDKVSVWLLDHPVIDFLVIPVMSMPFAYIFAPIIWGMDKVKN